MASSKNIVQSDTLLIDPSPITVGSPQWFEWLTTHKKFNFQCESGHFIAQSETRRARDYWYAYRRRDGKLDKIYLGKTGQITCERMEQACVSLAGSSLLTQFLDQPANKKKSEDEDEARIDSTLLPLSKVDIPVLPSIMVSRPRLTRQFNTPLTLIYAPSGFGKSTLLNEWRQTCGFPVAWLSLDKNANQKTRFWYSVVSALKAVVPGFGDDLQNSLNTTSTLPNTEIIPRLTRELNQLSASVPHIGLVLDDFHRINNADIHDSLQAWLTQFPPNMQVILSGHVKPPLALGDLRARCLVTELDTNDLRFTLDEGIYYLQQYSHTPPLSTSDLEKLTIHAEGWAAGLTLTALAMGRHEDSRHFVDTFSGAHIYIREYFMETVLQHSSPEVQNFLLKTAILKHLTGSLCDAVTGQNGGEETLARLWNDNLFIIKLEQQNWYRYHDLFAEMLLSMLQSRFPEEIPLLHQRAAKWYQEQYAPAEAIHHLLATQAWEEAASLMEDMALRELEQYGEDSRLLRWLQELPANVVQSHKTLLFVYLRLAYSAIPHHKIENFLTRIENNITSKSPKMQTQDEKDVLIEIQNIRNNWAQGTIFSPPIPNHSVQNEKWDLLNGLQLLRRLDSGKPEIMDRQIQEVLQKAEKQHNLFVILMTGGALSRRAFVRGQLRRSEKIARQTLEKVLAQRGKLPEPASISLSVLSRLYLERNEIELAQKYFLQIREVDPNPTSSNMFITSAILQSRIQTAQNQFDEALATIQAIQAVHLRHPSGQWSDQDLQAYEALICLRKGDDACARKLLTDTTNISEHLLSQLVQAELLLKKKQPDLAEIYL